MDTAAGKRIEEETKVALLRSRIVGSFKFIIFILSLALVVLQYDRKADGASKGTQSPSKGSITVESRTPGAGAEDTKRRKTRIENKEEMLGTALNSEESIMAWLGTIFKGGILIAILMLLRSFLPRKN